jgi:predicted amidohydrolase YtcJ
MNSMSRRIFAAALPLMAVGLASAAHSQGNPPENDAGATLFENVRIFDGKGASLSAPSNVLIKGNFIERISTEPIAAEPGVTVIAGNGRTLMPGRIDAHWHAMLIRPAIVTVHRLDPTGHPNFTQPRALTSASVAAAAG